MQIENRGLDALVEDSQTAKLYADHLYYFRCLELARYRGWGLKNLERKTQELASNYLATVEHTESFVGVRLRDCTRWINSLACTRLCMLWGKMEKWNWSTTRLACSRLSRRLSSRAPLTESLEQATARRTFYPNERARPPSDSTCMVATSVTSSIHKGIQYALEKLGKSKFGFESTTVSNFKSKRKTRRPWERAC